MSSAHVSAPSLARDASEIGWNLLEATFQKDAKLFSSAAQELRRLLERLDVISNYLRERDREGATPLVANKPLKRILANCPPEKYSEIFARIGPPAQALRAMLEGPDTGDGLPPNQVLADLKLQVANLTGHLSKADI